MEHVGNRAEQNPSPNHDPFSDPIHVVRLEAQPDTENASKHTNEEEMSEKHAIISPRRSLLARMYGSDQQF